MSEYIIYNGTLHNTDELAHYGVVGMKWGVRRNVAKAYERATKKMNKLNAKADKAKIKYGKKSGFHLTDFGVHAEKKARKKAARAEGKAVKWRRAMDKEFSAKKLTQLEQKHIRKGEEYVKKLIEASSSDKRKSYSDKSAASYAKGDEYKKLREKLHDN